MRPETTQRERFHRLRELLTIRPAEDFVMDTWGNNGSGMHCLGGWLPYTNWFMDDGWHVPGLRAPGWNTHTGYTALAAYFQITREQAEELFGGRRHGEIGSAKEVFLARLNKLEAELFNTQQKEPSVMNITINEPAETDLPLSALKAGEIAMIVKSLVLDDVGRLVVRGKYHEDAVLGSKNSSTGFTQDSHRAECIRVRRLAPGTTVTITL